MGVAKYEAKTRPMSDVASRQNNFVSLVWWSIANISELRFFIDLMEKFAFLAVYKGSHCHERQRHVKNSLSYEQSYSCAK